MPSTLTVLTAHNDRLMHYTGAPQINTAASVLPLHYANKILSQFAILFITNLANDAVSAAQT